MFRLLDTAINTEDYLLLKDETSIFARSDKSCERITDLNHHSIIESVKLVSGDHGVQHRVQSMTLINTHSAQQFLRYRTAHSL